MELKLAKKDFTDNFLSVIGKVVDVASVKVNKNGLSVICNKPETGVLVLGKYSYPFNVDTEQSLNIGDIKKLLRVIDCIEEEDVTFTINSNNLVYRSSSIQFKFHFIDDAIVPKTSVKQEKIDALVLDSYFDIEHKKLQEIFKVSSFTTDTNKIYIYGQTDGVYCELGDKEKSNTDSINLKISNKIEGQPLPQVLPFTLDVFRTLSGIRFNKARVGINLKTKVMVFYVKPTEESEFKFIISGLVK